MNGGYVTLQYDGDGNRVAETVGAVTTRYLVDDLNPTGYAQVLEELANGSVKRQYSYGLQRIDENQIVNNTWTPSFYGYDGGGTVRQLTSLARTVTDIYSYDAFGNLLASTGATPNNYLYRGEQYDQSLGLYYLRARYYNPVTGRFLSRDTDDGDYTNPATLHKYLYAEGNPVDGSDPSGQSTVMEPPTKTAPSRSASEYATIVIKIAIAAVPAVAAVGCAVNIALTVDALKTAGDTNIVTDLPHCSAKGQEGQTETCESKYPKYIPLEDLWYPFINEFAAFQEAIARNGGKQPRKSLKEAATDGPCSKDSGYVVGTHQNLLSGSSHVGDIVSCTACDDSSGEPTLTKRFDYVP